MNSITARFGALVFASLAAGVPFIAHSAPPAELPGIAEAPWRFSADIYGWLPSAPAAITVNDQTVADLPESLNTVISSLSFAAMARFDARKGPLGFYASPIFYDGTYDDNFVGKVSGAPRDYEISETVWLIDYGVSYEIGRWDIGAEPDSGIITLEPYAGFRFFHDKFRMNVDPIAFPGPVGDGVRVRKTISSNAPVIGLHSEWWLSRNLALHLKGDYGGFGVDKMDKTYQAISWFAYHFEWGKLHSKVLAGYRFLHLDLKDDPVEVKVDVRGPLIGLGFEF